MATPVALEPVLVFYNRGLVNVCGWPEALRAGNEEQRPLLVQFPVRRTLHHADL